MLLWEEKRNELSEENVSKKFELADNSERLSISPIKLLEADCESKGSPLGLPLGRAFCKCVAASFGDQKSLLSAFGALTSLNFGTLYVFSTFVNLLCVMNSLST